MTFEAEQAATARWLGYDGDVDAMNRHHDPLHRWLCAAIGIPSLSMAVAAGERVDDRGARLAAIEEDAVLAVQRLCQNAGTFPADLQCQSVMRT